MTRCTRAVAILAMAFLSGLAIYAVTQRALRASERRWMHQA